METLTLAQLRPDHVGAHAEFHESDGQLRSGRLHWGRNPSYRRLEVEHWWLVIPSGIPQFREAALSLQWLNAQTPIEVTPCPNPSDPSPRPSSSTSTTSTPDTPPVPQPRPTPLTVFARN
jgi:hypothetical protein